NPRSTVGTATEIYDYLRLLFARIGRTYCIQCGNEVKKDTVDEVAEAVLALGEGTRLNVWFPVKTSAAAANESGESLGTSRGRGFPSGAGDTKTRRSSKQRKGSEQPELESIKARLFESRQRGFNRLFQQGQVFEFSTPESLLDINFAEPVFVLVDRIAVSADSRARVVDASEIGFRESDEIIFETASREDESPKQLRFSQRFECKSCGIRYEEPEPRLFSFNNPYGACPRCQGFGNTIDFDLNLVVPDPTKTLNQGAIEPWTKPRYRTLATEMKRFARQAGIPLDVAWANLEPD